MNELKVLNEQEVLGKQFRVYGTAEEPLFLAKDVAEWIEHSKPSVMIESVDEDEKVKVNNVYFENRTGRNGTWFLTENGLYEVLMQSRKPIAKQFKKEVKEILKTIRKHGIYATDNVIDDINGCEEWRNIKGFENKYMVSNFGNVKSLNYMHKNKSHLLKQTVGNKGYLYVTLNKNGKHWTYFVHRLVAQAFIPNPNNLPTVNHMDECRTNNCVKNLEWLSYKDNNLYGNHYKRVSETQLNDPKKSKRVLQYDLNGRFIKKWESASEVQRKLSVNSSNIIQNCRENVKTAGGFIWKYA
nr:MAG TPA: homing endonuclease [Caudoviricetes sp.]